MLLSLSTKNNFRNFEESFLKSGSFLFSMKHTFPTYRKIDGFQRYYKIESESEFIEVQLLNGKHSVQKIQAIQYPEKLRILDMLALIPPFVEMEEQEIESFFANR